MIHGRRCARATVVAVAVALAACGGSGGSGGDGGSRPVVMATTGIWADVTSNVACGGLADVRTLVPPGADPHSFEPSLADRAEVESAALVVANGLGLEDGLAATLDAVEAAGTPLLRVGDHVDALPYATATGPADDHGGHDEDEAEGQGGHDEDEEQGHGGHDEDEEQGGGDHDHGGLDPHVWFDPTRVAAVLDVVGDSLVADVGLDPQAVEACVDGYRRELAAVDAEVAEILAGVPPDRRMLLTNHDSLGYLADRYGFEIVGTVIPVPSGLAETNPARLAELADLIEAAGVPAVFAEEQHSAADVEALAARVGDVEVVTLLSGSLGEEGSGVDTYVGLLLHDARLVADALG